jgi:Low affinity iron permease
MTSDKTRPRKKTGRHSDGGGVSRMFGDVANKTSQAAGRASAFMIAAGVVIAWAITGPLFQYCNCPGCLI